MSTPGATDTARQAVLDRRREQLESDIKSALNFLRGTDLVVKLMQAADSYAGKCCEAAELGIAAAEVKAVQRWMALDLWMALGKDSQDFEPFIAEHGWAETWAACLAAVRGAAAAERERIAADLTRRAAEVDDLVPAAGHFAHDYELTAVTLRNAAWAIAHGDEAENLAAPLERP